jgi:molybdopterin synthase sulfur carrier subunit
MTTRILFFGRLREAAGCAEVSATLPAGVLDQTALAAFIAKDDEALRAALSASSVRLAVDDEILPSQSQIVDAREIAFLPPFSGG